MFELVIVFVVTLIFYCYRLIRNTRPPNFPPGPKGVPFLGYAPFLGKYPHETIGELGKQYGKIFSFFLGRHPIVVLNDVKDIRTCMKSIAFSGRPKDKLLAMEVVPDGIVFNDGPSWEEQRRFSVKVLRDLGFGKKSMADAVQNEARELVDYFRKNTNKPINPRKTIQVSMINALWMIISSEKFSLDDPRAINLQRIVHEGFIEPEQAGICFFLPTIAKLFPKLTGFSKLLFAIEEMHTFLRASIDEHQRTLTDEPRDYIDVYLNKIKNTDDPNSSFYKDTGVKHLLGTLITFFTAGADTLTASTSYLLLYLVNHPEVMKKVQKEIDEVVGNSRLPLLEDRPNMPYLEAVLNETLRLSSILSGNIFHSTTETTVYEGYTLPKGTIVMANLFQVHHDPELWTKPREFIPERFLNEDGTFKKSENLIPFSIGKRVCPAENVAMAEFFVYSATILQNFSLQEHPDFPLPAMDDPKCALVLSPKEFNVVFVERKPTE